MERLEHTDIIKKAPSDQTPHLKGLFITGNRTAPYIAKGIPEPIDLDKNPIGFYKKVCKRCRSMRTTKSGKLINVYQRCDSCEKLLGVPSTAKSQGIYFIECTGCRKVNDVKYFQRWHCVDCGMSFMQPSEWQSKEQQQKQQDPLKTSNDTWQKVRRIVLERDDFTCQVCGNTNVRLDVHHITPRRDGGDDSVDNLITVCNAVCHKKMEPYKERINISITEETYHRIKNLAGKGKNDEETIVRLCEEIEEKFGSPREGENHIRLNNISSETRNI
jgi:hypothetical protein